MFYADCLVPEVVDKYYKFICGIGVSVSFLASFGWSCQALAFISKLKQCFYHGIYALLYFELQHCVQMFSLF